MLFATREPILFAKGLRLSASTALRIALGCFIGLGLFMYQRYEQSVAGVGLATPAEDLETATGTLRSLLAEAETSARGYALTRHVAFLEATNEAIAGTATQMARLTELALDDEDQKRRLAELQTAVGHQVNRARRLLDLARTGDTELLNSVVAEEALGATSERIAFLSRAMVDDARAAIDARAAELQQAVTTTRRLMVTLFVLAVALLFFAVLGIRRELRRRLDAELALRTAYAQVEERIRQRTGELVSTNARLRESEDRYRQLVEQKEQVLRERGDALAREQAARADAELANRFRDRFLSTVSHELRTPLNAIVGWTHLLRRGVTDDPERALEAIDRNAALQARLIDDLLDVSRMEQGRFTVAPAAIDLRDVVRASVTAAQAAAVARSVNFQVSSIDAPITVLGDPQRLQQALTNVLANAIKFSEPGGTVQVTLTADNGEAMLAVQDAGQGIDPAFLPHVFQAFRQDTTRPSRAGLGLGLAIARGIVERHQGTIRVDSAGRHKGTIFRISLPLGTEADLAVPAGYEDAAGGGRPPGPMAGRTPAAHAESGSTRPNDDDRRQKRARAPQSH